MRNVLPIACDDSRWFIRNVFWLSWVWVVGLFVPTLLGMADDDSETVRITNERAQKIVSRLNLRDSSKETRVRDCVAEFYRDLSTIHAKRDSRLQENQPSRREGGPDMSASVIRSEAESEQYRLHYAFLGQLGAELSAEAIDQIKDGITYDVVPKTYAQYLLLHTKLTDEQKRVIHTHLLEAREHAMDCGSSKEKHAMFGKYKGRINNYLSAQGFDAKQAERELKEVQSREK